MLIKLENCTTAEDALDKAGLLWNVEAHPLVTGAGKSVDTHNAIVRQDTGSVLGVVGDRYKIVQNADACSLLDTVIADNGGNYAFGGQTGGGKRVFLQAKMPQSFDAVPGDRVDSYITVVTSHDGSSPVKTYLTPIRLWCQNRLTISWQSRTFDFSIRHTASAEARMIEALHVYKAGVDAFAVFEQKAKYLANKAADRAKVQRFLEDLLPDTGSTRVKNQQERVLNLFESGKGNNGKTMWHLYNGATEWIDSERTSDSDKRLDSSLFGSGAALKAKALELAIAA